MKQTIEERLKALEEKVLTLEGGDLVKEEKLTGKKEMVSRPINV